MKTYDFRWNKIAQLSIAARRNSHAKLSVLLQVNAKAKKKSQLTLAHFRTLPPPPPSQSIHFTSFPPLWKAWRVETLAPPRTASMCTLCFFVARCRVVCGGWEAKKNQIISWQSQCARDEGRKFIIIDFIKKKRAKVSRSKKSHEMQKSRIPDIKIWLPSARESSTLTLHPTQTTNTTHWQGLFWAQIKCFTQDVS